MPKAAFEEKVVQEIGTIDDYKIRVVENKKGRFLDIREYVATDKYTGPTRKGVRIAEADYGTFLRLVAEVAPVFGESDLLKRLGEWYDTSVSGGDDLIAHLRGAGFEPIVLG